MQQPIQRIYRDRGTHVDRNLECETADLEPLDVPTIADLVPVTEIMTRDVACARRDLAVADLLALVIEKNLGCVPVVEEPGRPIGMITRVDLLAQCVGPARRPDTAGELMLPLAMTLGERATVAHAAAMMASEGIHHVPIVDGFGRLIGIVSSLDVVRWLARNDGFGLLLGDVPH